MMGSKKMSKAQSRSTVLRSHGKDMLTSKGSKWWH